VSFAPNAAVTRVVVDGPAGLTPDAVACIGQALASAQVEPFAGGEVTVGTTFFIR
jgi:hypothetical protein